MKKLNKRLTKRTLAAMCAAAMCAAAVATTALTGCAAGQKDDAGDAAGQKHEPLTVCNVNNLFQDDFIEAFREAHPEVRFDAMAYRGANGSGYAMASLEQGDIPDVYVSTYPFSPEAQREHLIDLSG
ncbi:MAG: hypothetical protein IJC51_02525, partial [Eggerthellaceae bacterium]|nr:hypothetical protein [Eggerthellaceae bacterium]